MPSQSPVSQQEEESTSVSVTEQQESAEAGAEPVVNKIEVPVRSLVEDSLQILTEMQGEEPSSTTDVGLRSSVRPKSVHQQQTVSITCIPARINEEDKESVLAAGKVNSRS